MIAKTILQQIGGKRFTAMTGSRDFIDMGNGLRMSLARNKTSANRLDIIYDEGASTICASTAGRSAKRPLSARQRTLPYTRVSILICWRKCSRW